MKLAIVLSLFCLSTISCQPTSNKAEQPISPIVQVNVDQFQTLMNTTTDYILLDVRTPLETAEGKIENALEIDYKSQEFESSINQLDPNKVVLIYCRSGKRSMKAAKVLEQKGFKKIYNLDGGFLKWNAKE